MAGQLANKVIVIIGGTTGLGLSAAKACVEADANVIVVGRNPKSVEAASAILGDSGQSLVGDATESSTTPRAIEHAVKTFGRFDGLYHVAGGSGRSAGDGPLHEVTDRGIDYTLDLNFKSVMVSNRAAVQHFLKHDTAGVVLNMGSVLGWSPSPHFFATHTYAATKAAIIGLTKSAAAYYASKNIRFNVLAPALVATPMSERAQENEAIMQFAASKQPLDGGRVGQPEDCDAAAVYLLSDAAKFVTGQVLAIDGGWTVTEGQWGG